MVGWSVWVVVSLVVFRVANALFLRTSFDPDEYWQCLEIAACLGLARGAPPRAGTGTRATPSPGAPGCHWTWEWQEHVRIRGFAHPLLFAALYSAVAAVGMDSRDAVAYYAPRVVAGVAAAAGDVATWRLGTKLFGARTGYLCLLCQLANWFYFYACVRTYSNSAEAVLTMWGLVYWPLRGNDNSDNNNNNNNNDTFKALCFAALAVIMRPSAAAFWVYLGLRHLVVDLADTPAARVPFLLRNVGPVGLSAFGVMMATDRWGYGEWTLVPLNFVRVNIIERVGEEYGVHVWHWYLSNCLLAIVGTWLPALALGAWHVVVVGKRRSRATLLVEFVAWGFLVLSVSGHKELRFALPLLPPLCVLCGFGLAQLDLARARTRAYVGVACASNVCVAVYLARWHQAAPLAVMDFLATTAAPAPVFVDMYTRCHATPLWSHLHGTSVQRVRFLDCSPAVAALAAVPAMQRSVLEGVEEEDLFLADPVAFLEEHRDADMRTESLRPTHVVLSTDTPDAIAHLERRHGFKECARFFHTWHESFVVLCSAGLDLT